MKTWFKENWGFIAVIVGALLWMHIVLIQDQQNLCSNEATAYSGCSK